MLSGGQSSTSMPRCRPIPDSTSLISFKDLRPKFGVRSISASVFWIRSNINDIVVLKADRRHHPDGMRIQARQS